MRFLPVALLGLASIAIADLSSWSDVVGDVPQCIQTCLNEFYSDSGLESACGSADTASVKCLCGVKDSASDIQDEGNQLSSCIQTGCTSTELNDSRTELQDFETRYSELMTQCTNEGKLEPYQTFASPLSNPSLESGSHFLFTQILPLLPARTEPAPWSPVFKQWLPLGSFF